MGIYAVTKAKIEIHISYTHIKSVMKFVFDNANNKLEEYLHSIITKKELQ